MWSVQEVETVITFVAYLIYNEVDKYKSKKLNDATYQTKKVAP